MVRSTRLRGRDDGLQRFAQRNDIRGRRGDGLLRLDQQKQIRHHAVQMTAGRPHLPCIPCDTLPVAPALFQGIRQIHQRFGGLQQLFGDVRDERVARLGEPDDVAQILDHHHHEPVADAPHGDLQPIRAGHRPAAASLLGFGAQIVEGVLILPRRAGFHVELRASAMLADLMDLLQHTFVGDRVVDHHSQGVCRGTGPDDLVIVILRHLRIPLFRQFLAQLLGQIGIQRF